MRSGFQADTSAEKSDLRLGCGSPSCERSSRPERTWKCMPSASASLEIREESQSSKNSMGSNLTFTTQGLAEWPWASSLMPLLSAVFVYSPFLVPTGECRGASECPQSIHRKCLVLSNWDLFCSPGFLFFCTGQSQDQGESVAWRALHFNASGATLFNFE